jgi:DNA-binding NtrC family response regulator
LLRTLQSHEFEPVGSNKTEKVDVRVILATNLELEAEVAAGRFREDLFYRINVITLTMPTLKERVSDIPLLAKHFLEKYASESKRQIYGITDDALAIMQRHDWPGNVRELENAIERAVVLAKGRQITVDDLPPKAVASAPVETSVADYQPRPLREALERPEKRIIESALRANGWNRQRTAEQLEINRTTLYKKMKRYGLEPEASQVC